jgi:hypothetical protein
MLHAMTLRGLQKTVPPNLPLAAVAALLHPLHPPAFAQQPATLASGCEIA